MNALFFSLHDLCLRWYMWIQMSNAGGTLTVCWDSAFDYWAKVQWLIFAEAVWELLLFLASGPCFASGWVDAWLLFLFLFHICCFGFGLDQRMFLLCMWRILGVKTCQHVIISWNACASTRVIHIRSENLCGNIYFQLIMKGKDMLDVKQLDFSASPLVCPVVNECCLWGRQISLFRQFNVPLIVRYLN